MKIYLKRGNKNYKERRLLDALEPIIKKRIEENPYFENEVVPATNFQELQNMYTKYVPEEATEVEFTENTENTEQMGKTNEIEDDLTDDSIDFSNDADSVDVDPLNREAPIVYDYVYGEDSLSKTPQPKVDPFAKFDEPTSFGEAFDIPDADVVEEDNDSQDNDSSSSQNQRREQPKQKSNEPLNPAYDEMSNAKKKRSTKKFAKYIVETVCMLSEKGFVWFANKDINEAKLTEYEINGEMDLSILVALEDGQEITVKQFFQSQCLKAEQMAIIPEEQRADLADALAEVLAEKGVGPTPTQELMLVAFSVLGGQVIQLMTLKAQTGSLLTQLRAMNEGNGNNNYQEPKRERPQQTFEPTAPAQESFIPEIEPESPSLTLVDDVIETDLTAVVETKE